VEVIHLKQPKLKCERFAVRLFSLKNSMSDDPIFAPSQNRFLYVGRTLCNPAPVVDLLKAIKEHAFVASEYPVVLTIENHLPIPLQKLLAQVRSPK
jgi:hypothetical protein